MARASPHLHRPLFCRTNRHSHKSHRRTVMSTSQGAVSVRTRTLLVLSGVMPAFLPCSAMVRQWQAAPPTMPAQRLCTTNSFVTAMIKKMLMRNRRTRRRGRKPFTSSVCSAARPCQEGHEFLRDNLVSLSTQSLYHKAYLLFDQHVSETKSSDDDRWRCGPSVLLIHRQSLPGYCINSGSPACASCDAAKRPWSHRRSRHWRVSPVYIQKERAIQQLGQKLG